jgi:CRISPR system Cascade subunit CasD
VNVRFFSDTPFPDHWDTDSTSLAPVTVLNDEPVRLTARDRVYRSRRSHTTTLDLPADRCAGHGIAYLDALTTYLNPTARQGTTA